MKKNRIQLFASACIVILSTGAYARENVNTSGGVTPGNGEVKSVMTACAAASAQVDLDINNVRATLLNGGDMWWNLSSAQYEVPKGSGIKSLFAGSLWIGGIDGGGQLKVAAMTYRQTGNDYWPGPLTSSATTDASTCVQYDRFWKVNRTDVEKYKNWIQGGSNGAMPISATAVEPINSWPAYNAEGQSLAPYYDQNGDNFYDPNAGDYPYFDFAKIGDCTKDQLFGDQAIWWVFNDKGNLHSETGGAAIGLEIQAQAFAFNTTDEINDMTFYNYKIINKSSFTINATHFGVWVDADLGGYNDDYVGCDAENGFGYTYNGDLIDEGASGVLGYGANPPACGVDFFRGPYADANGIADPSTGTLNGVGYGDTAVDNERLGMERFMYYNNNTDPINGNPNAATDFYNYLIGKWQNSTDITYGGNAVGGSTPCKFVFPWDSDPTNFGTGGIPESPWSEQLSNNPFVDRRFMQVAGPFTLMPGAVNVITTGVVWARATQGGPLASLSLLKGADKKAQKLFNNCFATLDGPTAPDLTIQELSNELVLYWTNPATSNDSAELYSEDPDKAVGNDSLYRFQGYQIFQLKDNTVSATELYNVDRARLVFQCDKKDGVGQIVNYTYDPGLGANVPTEMVNGADAGIVHSITLTTDKFATGDNTLINHKTYYYMIIAYGYSSSEEFDAFSPYQDAHPYIAGRFNTVTGGVAGIPHIPTPESGGTEAHSTYGSGPKMKRIEGQGNGGNILDFTDETVSRILSSSTSRVIDPVYDNGHGPFNVKVIDPLNVTAADFRLTLLDPSAGITVNSTWKLENLTTGEVVTSEVSIKTQNEQIINGQATGTSVVIPKWGLAVTGMFAYDPGNASATNNGALEGTVTYADPSKMWMTGLPDQEGQLDLNWIRSGTATFTDTPEYNDIASVDNGQFYEKLANGTWAPYRMCAFTTAPAVATNPIVCRGGPAWDKFQSLALPKNIASVDVIITSDPSKWTRCPVIELQEESTLAVGGAKKMSIRRSQSVDKDGNPASIGSGASSNPNDPNYISETGMGWFPGYAVNLETGERLNMAFGEDSWLVDDHGADMRWNPSSSVFSSGFDPLFGGKHYIYVFGHNGDKTYSADAVMGNGLKDIPRYDAGAAMVALFKATDATSGATSDGYKREIYSDAMWVSMPILIPGHSYFETDVKVRLRVAKSYQKGYSTTAPPVTDTAAVAINANKPVYEFNTADLETHTNDAVSAKDGLSLINIVPNPYYAYSGYEKKSLETIVKITNLPDKCTITIYTLNGNLVRKLSKDDTKTSMDWDMKNEARIPIASGLYIIHVDVPGVGEKTLKWFGVLRPIDLDAY